MLMMRCERDTEYKPPKRKKKSKLEDTCSRKCGCEFSLRGYSDKKTIDCWLVILNRVHNHKMEPKLDSHLLTGILKTRKQEESC